MRWQVTSHSGQHSAGQEISIGQGALLYGREDNHRSVVALAMHYILCDSLREMSTPPVLLSGVNGTLCLLAF